MTESIRSIIDARFGGVLRAGKHEPDGQACALLRPLNDAPWSSDQARTEALVPVLEALWDWPEWSEGRRQAWVEIVALRTAREVFPIALRAAGLEAEAIRCEQAETLAEAASTAAAAEAAARAAWAARARASDAGAENWAAAWAATAAAWAARAAWAAWAARAAEAAAAGAARAAAEATAEATAGAARAAARAAAGDDVLRLACRIWIEAAQEVAA